MLDISDKVFLGKILKTHGISGDIILQSKTLSAFEDINLELVFIVIDGKPVPFFIQQIRPKSNETFIIQFDHIKSIQQAREICGCEVYADEDLSQEIDQQDGLFKFIGYTLLDHSKNEVGVIHDVIDQTSNILFRVLKDNREWLIPASDDLIIKSSRRKKTLIMQIPDGLLEL